jgi:hypothetical protein
VFWLFHDRQPQHEHSSSVRFVSDSVRFLETFLPRGAVRWWTDWYATNPEWFLAGVLAVAGLIWIGSRLGGTINDRMRTVWLARSTTPTIRESQLHMTIYRLRTHPVYQWVLNSARRHVLPFISAMVLAWIALAGTSHLLFYVADSAGAFCIESEAGETKVLEVNAVSDPILFKPSDPCLPTKIQAVAGARYAFTFTVILPWKDCDFDTSPSGFKSNEVPNWWGKAIMYIGVPLRRALFRRWFDVIARVGSIGVAEDFLDPSPRSATVYEGETARLRRDGELFLYVNDGVLPLPWIYSVFYWNNQGEAQVTIKRIQ